MRKASAARAFITCRICAPTATIDEAVAFGKRLADIGWHLQIHMAAELIGELTPALKRSPVPVVIDHMGRVDASQGLDQEPFKNLLRLLEDRNVWVKVSGSDRVTRQGPPYADAVPFARKLVEEAGDRCVWGLDWPHPNHTRAGARRRRAGRYPGGDRAERGAAAGGAGRQSAAPLPVRTGGQEIRRTRMNGRLQDKVAIVTGAGCVGPGWGNGRATAVRFAQEGAKIFAVDLKPESVEETVQHVKEAGGEIVVHQCDVTSGASVAAMVQACVKHYGRIDVLVNNVGGSAHGGPVEMTEEVWDAQVDYNLKSVFLTLKHVLPVMERQKKGAIVNVGVELRPALDRRARRSATPRPRPASSRCRAWSPCNTPARASA